MLLLGLTGNIACGKSTVARMLEARGAAVLDADGLVHELYAESEFASQVAALFHGKNVRNEAGGVDRSKLGPLVFGNEESLRRLELLVHPAVARLRARKLQELRSGQNAPRAVVLEAVKLIESGQADDCDVVWCVVCAPGVQLRRLMEHRGLSEEEAKARLSSQPSLEGKEARLRQMNVPLVLIENNGGRDELAVRVEAAWGELTAQS